jgi:2',3'-cyclic-nucleotide 2'-phosphodiesterase (5'-nucleotidase family)
MENTNKMQLLLNEIQYWRGRLVGVVVHINDTYLLDERPPNLPGFARVIATVERIRQQTKQVLGADRLLVIHSGDFLGPSRVAESRNGRRAMISLLNKLGLDFCVLGNHEFDYGEQELEVCLEDAEFRALLSNVVPPKELRSRIHREGLWPTADPVVALTGIVSESVFRGFPKRSGGWSFSNAADAMRDFGERTHEIPFHLVLSHAERGEDRTMRQALEDCPRTYILGGHDHNMYAVENDSRPLLMKNLANLQTVRVLLLLAGGDQAMQVLFREYASLRDLMAAEPQYPTHTEMLLEKLSEPDARVFRTWIESRDSLYTGPDHVLQSVGLGYFTDEDQEDLPARAIVSVLADMPFHQDMSYWILRYSDHGPAHADAQKIVQEGQSSIKEADEEDIVRDFSQDTSTDLDCREASIRTMPTDFGVFVAECIRREGDAHVAIINSGSFRSDAFLPRVLRVRDLRDTFLYDKRPSIVVLEMNGTVAQALLQHGLAKVGLGAYPQVASASHGPNAMIKVAISSFLLTRSQDGYADVVMRETGRSESEIQRWVDSGNAFRIVEAIRKQGAHVAYTLPKANAFAGDAATEFIDRAWRLSELFENAHPYDQYRHVDWNTWFKAFLSGKSAGDNGELLSARQEARKLILELPAISTYYGGGRDTAGLRELALTALQGLRQHIVEHQRSFEDRIAYSAIFDALVTGIAGYDP